MFDVIDECVKLKLQSIEGILEKILTTSPSPNDDNSIQTLASNIYSRPFPPWSVQNSEGQPDCPSSVQSTRTLADSLEQAEVTATVTKADAVADRSWSVVLKDFLKAGARSEHWIAVTEWLKKDCVVRRSTVLFTVLCTLTVATAIWYGLSTYTLQEDALLVY